MLRISANGNVLYLEGQVAGPWVEELAMAYRQFQPVTLDLSDVTFADADGVALLKSLNARMTGLSPFMEERLKQPVS